MLSKLHSVDDKTFKNLLRQALGYALLSAPFTINRMGLKSLGRRIENITKGKLAEQMIVNYCRTQNINADFMSCETPFYQVDKRDFLLNDYEWDIKNNFLSTDFKDNTQLNIGDLPALIPDRFKGDQWSKKDTNYHHKKGVRFLFTFMIKSSGVGEEKRNLFSLHFSESQKKLLSNLVDEYGGKSMLSAPYTEDWFWQEWRRISKESSTELLQVNFNSPIFIAGWAGTEHWAKFKSAAPKVWSDGLIKTRIENKYLLCSSLVEF